MLRMLIFYCFISRHSGERVATGLSYLCKRNHGGAAVQRAFGPVQGSVRRSRGSMRLCRGSRFKVLWPRSERPEGRWQRSRFKVALRRGRVVVSGKGLLRSFVGSVNSIPKPRSWVYRNWVNIAYILRKGWINSAGNCRNCRRKSRGSMRLCRGSRFKVQGSKVDDKVLWPKGTERPKGRWQVYNIRHHPSGIIHLFRTSPFFEHPPSPSTLKGLHLSLVFSLLRRKKTAPPVALTLW